MRTNVHSADYKACRNGPGTENVNSKGVYLMQFDTVDFGCKQFQDVPNFRATTVAVSTFTANPMHS